MVQIFPVSLHQSEVHPNRNRKMRKGIHVLGLSRRKKMGFACRIISAASPREMDCGVTLSSPVCLDIVKTQVSGDW